MPETRKQVATRLLERLMREYFQTETSASRHCRREAERFTDAAYAGPFRLIAAHADQVLETLPAIARQENLPVSPGGSAVGALFSQARDKMADKLIDAERSYRGTMLGLRHGVDLVKLIEAVAKRHNRPALTTFCQGWLQQRQPLVDQSELGFGWFAEHPDRANERPRSILGVLRPQRTA
jgi:hypothetical protein